MQCWSFYNLENRRIYKKRRVILGVFARSRKSPISLVMSVRPSFIMNQRGSRIFVKSGIGKVYENVLKIQIWLKSYKNIGHFTPRPKCVSHCWQRYININNTKGTHCFVSMAKMVTGTRHVTLYVQCLLRFLQFPFDTIIAPINVW